MIVPHYHVVYGQRELINVKRTIAHYYNNLIVQKHLFISNGIRIQTLLYVQYLHHEQTQKLTAINNASNRILDALDLIKYQINAYIQGKQLLIVLICHQIYVHIILVNRDLVIGLMINVKYLINISMLSKKINVNSLIFSNKILLKEQCVNGMKLKINAQIQQVVVNLQVKILENTIFQF
ncbi:unnamed protein product [Paramecium pentaurelia]|uniref:Uncharacterized protein n=1 Tax=Paramecium pentaurelia TaxID=43138 RepID=A0A8S1WL62_9CILI|nr:unnamed protein product [Paramecium pentaurelia]